MRNSWFICCVLLAALVLAGGCIFHAQHHDPLAGWKAEVGDEPNPEITKDYQGYIESLSPKEKNSRGPIAFFKDGTGKHAIRFETGRNGTSYSHVLIYNNDNKRIETIKRVSGHYAS